MALKRSRKTQESLFLAGHVKTLFAPDCSPTSPAKGSVVVSRDATTAERRNLKMAATAILALTGISHADILRDETELKARYGKPVKVIGDSRLYNWFWCKLE